MINETNRIISTMIRTIKKIKYNNGEGLGGLFWFRLSQIASPRRKTFKLKP